VRGLFFAWRASTNRSSRKSGIEPKKRGLTAEQQRALRLLARGGQEGFTEAILQAFDLLELNGEDFRPLSLGERKKRLARLLARTTPRIALCEHTDAAGELVFRQARAWAWKGSCRSAWPLLSVCPKSS
jgi:hypothetical protein